ncbi:MAG: glycosyltransferase, partial [Gemmatimonadaceae bacterium]
GYALSYAFELLLGEGRVDAVVVVDADTSVSPNLLTAFDAAIITGAEAMQAHYGVRDPGQSWRTRLVSLGLMLFHGVRSSARESLGVSCGLRGNGMCFRADLLRRVPHTAYSIVEDLEYGIALGLAGVRVVYVEDAQVSGDMPTTTESSRSQRARWEGGRREIRHRYARELLATACKRRDVMLLDLALDLLVPPLSAVVAGVMLGFLASTAFALAIGSFSFSVVLWSAALVGLAIYIGRGCVMTGNFVRAIGDLAWAPVFMIWKLTVRSSRAAKQGEWVRTRRTAIGRGDA